MSWIQRYRLRFYIRNSLWILPALSMPVALLAGSLLTRYEQAIGSQTKELAGVMMSSTNTIE